MAGTGETQEGAQITFPPLAAEGTPQRERDLDDRWRVLEDHLNTRIAVTARIVTNVVVPADPTLEGEIVWESVDEDTSQLWDGASRFIIDKDTAGDYSAFLQISAASLDGIFGMEFIVAVYEVDGPFGPTTPRRVMSIYTSPDVPKMAAVVPLKVKATDQIAVLHGPSGSDQEIIGVASDYDGGAGAPHTKFTLKRHI